MTGKNKTKKSLILKWVLIGVVVLGSWLGVKTIQAKKMMNERRAMIEEQRQVMVDHYKELGLSDEEIDEKLKTTMREERGVEGESRGGGFSIMRIMTGGRRPGGR
ncbi:MAG: hypothetical protein ABIJ43_02690 [Candidatus Beckwithbacteria bacterium]|nr:hypothetical protein [Patescibacteria group bacterium]